MNLDTLHPRPWRVWLNWVLDRDGRKVCICESAEAAAHIADAVNAGHEVGRRALAVEGAYERQRGVL